MTTVAQKNNHIGADKRRTSKLPCGSTSYDDSVTKVFKFGSIEWGQAGMVGLTELLGLHLQGFDVAKKIKDFCFFCNMNKIKKEHVVGQILVYNSGKRSLVQTGAQLVDKGKTIESGNIPVESFSIGSGAEFAYPILVKGGDIKEAIEEAMIHDEGTGGGIEMAHEQQDKNNVVTLAQPTSVEESLRQDEFIDQDGNFTKKSLGYTSTKLLNLEELAKMGLVNEISQM